MEINVKAEWDGRKAHCVVTDANGEEIRSGRELRVRTEELPDTGDHSHLPLYLAVAIAALVMLWWMRRRRV